MKGQSFIKQSLVSGTADEPVLRPPPMTTSFAGLHRVSPCLPLKPKVAVSRVTGIRGDFLLEKFRTLREAANRVMFTLQRPEQSTAYVASRAGREYLRFLIYFIQGQMFNVNGFSRRRGTEGTQSTRNGV
jgi:hypothetical protein